MELRRYIALFRSWWWLIALLVFLGGAAGFLANRNASLTYQATTTLLINQGREELPEVNAVNVGERLARTHAELMLQQDILEGVLSDTGVDLDLSDIVNMVFVESISDTNLLNLIVVDSDPDRAVTLANAIARDYIDVNHSRQNVRFDVIRQSLEQDIEVVQGEIVVLRTKIQQLASESGSLATAADNNQQEILNIQNRLDEVPSVLTGDQQAQLERQRDDRVNVQIGLQEQIDDLQGEIAALEVGLSQAEARYGSFLASVEELRLAEAEAADFMSIVQEAEFAVPGGGISSSVRVLQGAIVGATLAIAVIVLSENLNVTVRSTDEAESLTGVPTLGVIGRIYVESVRDVLVTILKPRSPSAEAYLVLRTNLELCGVGEDIRAIVVTSSGDSEGKTTTAANLAIALAQTGKRVILVDTDLRQPELHKLFRRKNASGVTNVLSGSDGRKVDEYLVGTDVEDLRLLPSGPLPPNPTDYLQSSRMSDMIADLKSISDVVLFDSPSSLATADATLLAHACDASVLVVQADKTSGGALKQASDRLIQSGSPLLGVVVNRVRTPGSGYFYWAPNASNTVQAHANSLTRAEV